jgi:hypothetical protein
VLAGDRCACGGLQPKFRRGVVDIQVKLSTLMCLDEDPALIPGWGPLIADVARQVAADREANPAWKWTVTDEYGRVLHHGHTRRRPTATEKAFIKARDRTCRAPGCRRPAIGCDDDHRQEHANGGASHRGVLCVLCRHHHRLRHELGYDHYPMSGLGTIWTAPNGRIYLTGPDDNIILTIDEPNTDLTGQPPDWDDATLAKRDPKLIT